MADQPFDDPDGEFDPFNPRFFDDPAPIPNKPKPNGGDDGEPHDDPIAIPEITIPVPMHERGVSDNPTLIAKGFAQASGRGLRAEWSADKRCANCRPIAREFDSASDPVFEYWGRDRRAECARLGRLAKERREQPAREARASAEAKRRFDSLKGLVDRIKTALRDRTMAHQDAVDTVAKYGRDHGWAADDPILSHFLAEIAGLARELEAPTPKPADNNERQNGKRGPYAVMLAGEITLEAHRKVCMITDFLGRHEQSCWYGAPESGKSTCIIDAACHVANGLPYCGRAVIKGAVLYVAAERGRNVKRRVLAWRLDHGRDDFPLGIIDDAVDLRTGKVDADRIIAAAQWLAAKCGLPVVWIIFDTLSRVLAGGDENSSRDMGELVKSVDRIFRETGAHCSLVHHNPLGVDRMRGWGGMNGAMDTTVHIEKANGVVTVAVDKASDLPEDEKPRFAFRFESVVLVAEPRETASVMIEAEAPPAVPAKADRSNTKRPPQGPTVMRDALNEVFDGRAENITLRNGATVKGVKIDDVEAEFRARYVTTGDPKKAADTMSRQFRRQTENPPKGWTSVRVGKICWFVKD
jgi:AAA domain